MKRKRTFFVHGFGLGAFAVAVVVIWVLERAPQPSGSISSIIHDEA